MVSMGDHAGGQAQAAGQFRSHHLMGVITHHHVDFVLARVQIIEQPLGIQRAAGSGDGNKDLQCKRIIAG